MNALLKHKFFLLQFAIVYIKTLPDKLRSLIMLNKLLINLQYDYQKENQDFE